MLDELRGLEDDVTDLRRDLNEVEDRVDDLEDNGIDNVLGAIEEDGFLNIGDWQIGQDADDSFYILQINNSGTGLYTFDPDDEQMFPV